MWRVTKPSPQVWKDIDAFTPCKYTSNLLPLPALHMLKNKNCTNALHKHTPHFNLCIPHLAHEYHIVETWIKNPRKIHTLKIVQNCKKCLLKATPKLSEDPPAPPPYSACAEAATCAGQLPPLLICTHCACARKIRTWRVFTLYSSHS